MKLSDKLLVLANWLESSENDILVNADSNESHLNIIANSLVNAANALKKGAEELKEVEPEGITPESLDEIATLAQILDECDDDFFKKKASVLDELLITMAAPRNALINFRDTQDDRIEELKKKYKDTKSKQDEMNKVSDSIKHIEEAPVYKQYRILEAPLSSRHCPDHAGCGLIRISESTWQCVLDKKQYNYESGYTTLKGNKIPGGNVSEQTPSHSEVGHTMFDTRSGRLGTDIK